MRDPNEPILGQFAFIRDTSKTASYGGTGSELLPYAPPESDPDAIPVAPRRLGMTQWRSQETVTDMAELICEQEYATHTDRITIKAPADSFAWTPVVKEAFGAFRNGRKGY